MKKRFLRFGLVWLVFCSFSQDRLGYERVSAADPFGFSSSMENAVQSLQPTINSTVRSMGGAMEKAVSGFSFGGGASLGADMNKAMSQMPGVMQNFSSGAMPALQQASSGLQSALGTGIGAMKSMVSGVTGGMSDALNRMVSGTFSSGAKSMLQGLFGGSNRGDFGGAVGAPGGAGGGGPYSLQDALKEHGGNIAPKYLPGMQTQRTGSAKDITTVAQKATNVLIGFAGVVTVFFFVWNAVVLVLSVGGAEEITKAKRGLTWAAVGLVLIIFAYVIVKSIIFVTYSGG